MQRGRNDFPNLFHLLRISAPRRFFIRVIGLLAVAPALVSHAQTLTPEMEKTWREQIRANFFIPDPLPELKATTHRRFEPAPGG